MQISKQKINSCKNSIDISQEFWNFSPVLLKPEISRSFQARRKRWEKRCLIVECTISLHRLYSFGLTQCCGPYIKSHEFVKTEMSESQQPFLIHQSSTSKQKESISYVPLEQIKHLHKYLWIKKSHLLCSQCNSDYTGEHSWTPVRIPLLSNCNFLFQNWF